MQFFATDFVNIWKIYLIMIIVMYDTSVYFNKLKYHIKGLYKVKIF